MQPKRCLACKQMFRPHPHVPGQTYCSKVECQLERKRRWQREKRASDPDYKENQARAQKAWSRRNPQYWRVYRAANPDYEEGNRVKQRLRNKEPMSSPARMDGSGFHTSLLSGTYRLERVGNESSHPQDVWIIEISHKSYG